MKRKNEMFIPYKLALTAYEKGFKMDDYNYINIGWYYKQRNSGEIHGLDVFYIDTNQNIQQWERLKEPVEAILYQQITDWFRDKHKLHFYIVPYGDCKHWNLANIGRTDLKTDDGRLDYIIRSKYSKTKFKTYYEALNTAIEEALKKI
jgi:hypothetical protein